jgi:hypothetical protein
MARVARTEPTCPSIFPGPATMAPASVSPVLALTSRLSARGSGSSGRRRSRRRNTGDLVESRPNRHQPGSLRRVSTTFDEFTHGFHGKMCIVGLQCGLLASGSALFGCDNRSSRKQRCRSPIEMSLPSPIEMSLAQAVVETFGVTCDGGDPDERTRADPAARAD